MTRWSESCAPRLEQALRGICSDQRLFEEGSAVPYHEEHPLPSWDHTGDYSSLESKVSLEDLDWDSSMTQRS